MTGNHMHHRSLAFEHTFDFQQPSLHDGSTTGFQYPGPDHHSDVVGFIFSRRTRRAARRFPSDAEARVGRERQACLYRRRASPVQICPSRVNCPVRMLPIV